MTVDVRRRCLGAAAGIVLDRLVGEPRVEPHPVALLGRSLGALERRTYADARSAGVVHAAVGVGFGAASGAALRSTALATWLAVAGRMLGDVALDVADALQAGDLERARGVLPALVGRDPSSLDEAEICRAVVESVAENTVDAVVAPALWAALLGAPGAVGHKTVSTLDSMVGHRSARYQRFGWASARLDDVAAWAPARATAMLVALARPRRAGAVWRAVRADAGGHPSPNAGVAEAAFAAALGLRLGGTNRYEGRIEHRPVIAGGRPVRRDDIDAAARLSRDVAFALALALTVPAAAAALRALPWNRSGHSL